VAEAQQNSVPEPVQRQPSGLLALRIWSPRLNKRILWGEATIGTSGLGRSPDSSDAVIY
jgi:hypothetical protein